MPTNPVTEEQAQEAREAYERYGNYSEAGRALGLSPKALKNRMQGGCGRYGPISSVPEGHIVKGVSTLYGPEGEVKGQWVKTAQNAEREESLLSAIEAAVSGFRATRTPPPKSSKNASQTLTIYPMGDPHIGLYSWADESGVDFDCDIAEKNLVSAVERLVSTAPDSRECLILNLGDFYHSDNMSNQTSRSGNVLDVDTRWPKVLEIGIRTMLRCVDRALEKHRTVRVRNVIGNHDDHTSIMLSKMLALYYEREKRVVVEDSPAAFWYRRFGKVLIGSTHGDRTKMAQLPPIMAADVPEDWGASTHRYIYTGHIHTQTVQEFPGCIVESFRTLAGKDAWHAREGYRSGRDMYCIVHDPEHGEIERHRVDVAML